MAAYPGRTVAAMRLTAMLRSWGAAGKAAILGLCIVIAAQSAGVYAASAHDHSSCGRATATANKNGAPHSKPGNHHQSHSEAPASDATDAHSHDGNNDTAGKSHASGCCGWLCSAATLPPMPEYRPASMTRISPQARSSAAREKARLDGLFRPPRLLPLFV
jgi:hypothetical protein